MLSSNLHLAACHLRQQERQHGPLALCTEFWVERALQLQKTLAGRKLSRRPATFMANNELQSSRLSELAGTGLGATFDELVPAYRSLPLQGPRYDAGDPSTEVQALHRGKRLTGEGRRDKSKRAARSELAAAHQAVRSFLSTQSPRPPAFAMADSAERATIYVHSQMSRGGRDLLSSRYHSASSRCSAHVAITYCGNNQFVGQVQHFLRVVPAPQDDPAGQHGPLRLAVLRLYAPRRPRGAVLVAERGKWEGGDDGPLRTVDVLSIDAALITATEVGGAGRGRDLMRLVKYGNCSRG